MSDEHELVSNLTTLVGLFSRTSGRVARPDRFGSGGGVSVANLPFRRIVSTWIRWRVEKGVDAREPAAPRVAMLGGFRRSWHRQAMRRVLWILVHTDRFFLYT